MIWTFLAGMFCGAALLIALILVTDRSFLDLIAVRVVGNTSDSAELLQSLHVKNSRSVAVGSDS